MTQNFSTYESDSVNGYDFIGIKNGKINFGPIYVDGFELEQNFLDTIFIDILNQYNVNSIRFLDDFDLMIPKNLPNTLKEIYFGREYNHPTDNLPESIETIEFGFKFNHPVNGLPPNLKKLVLGNSFKQDLSNLPLGLKILIIHNISIPNLSSLPESLEYLSVEIKTYTHALIDNINPELFSNLPNGLKYLVIGYASIFNLSNLPDSIIHLTLQGQNINHSTKFPKNLKNLVIHYNWFDETLNFNQLDFSNTNIEMLALEISNVRLTKKISLILPESLELLKFNQDCFVLSETLPSKLKYIFVESKFIDDNSSSFVKRYNIPNSVFINCCKKID